MKWSATPLALGKTFIFDILVSGQTSTEDDPHSKVRTHYYKYAKTCNL